MTSRDPSKKSKKRSASNSTSNKQPEPPLTVFVDECLGRIKVPAALRAAGVDVKILEDEFQAGTPFKPVLNTTYLEVACDQNTLRRRGGPRSHQRSGSRPVQTRSRC